MQAVPHHGQRKRAGGSGSQKCAQAQALDCSPNVYRSLFEIAMRSSGSLAAVLGGAAAIGAFAAWRAATASGSTPTTITLQKLGRTARGKRQFTATPAATGASPQGWLLCCGFIRQTWGMVAFCRLRCYQLVQISGLLRKWVRRLGVAECIVPARYPRRPPASHSTPSRVHWAFAGTLCPALPPLEQVTQTCCTCLHSAAQPLSTPPDCSLGLHVHLSPAHSPPHLTLPQQVHSRAA